MNRSRLSALLPGSPAWQAKKARNAERAEFRRQLAVLNGVEQHTPPPADPADADEIPPKVREAALERDGRACTQCPSHYELHVHHRQMRSQGGPHELANLITLCPSCHRGVHNDPMHSYAWGLLVHSYADPARVPVWRRTAVGRGGRYFQGRDGSLTLAAD